MRRIGWAPNNARKWEMGYNSAFKGLKYEIKWDTKCKLNYKVTQIIIIVLNRV
jgi:hypothetical protein